jgi:hypothetical protein
LYGFVVSENGSRTTQPTTQVATDADGRLLWNLSQETGECWVELEAADATWAGFRFRLTYSSGGDLQGVAVSRSPAASKLTARQLQRVPLGDLDRAARECVRAYVDEWEALNLPTALLPGPRSALGAIVEPQDLDDETLLRLASLARAYVDLNGTPGWRETLAEEFGWSPATIPSKVTQARKRGLLTSAGRGQQGGQLTHKAWRLLGPLPPSAWDRATDEQRKAALDRNALQARIEAELFEQYRDGQMDEDSFRARYLAVTALLFGSTPVSMYPDEDPQALRAASKYLKATYPELR